MVQGTLKVDNRKRATVRRLQLNNIWLKRKLVTMFLLDAMGFVAIN
jgi:hypothetical protein